MVVIRFYLVNEMSLFRVTMPELMGFQSICTVLWFPRVHFWNAHLLCIPLASFLLWADILGWLSHFLKGHDFHIFLGKAVFWSSAGHRDGVLWMEIRIGSGYQRVIYNVLDVCFTKCAGWVGEFLCD